ncbi:MAG: PAS/PAC sensor signal transduction histidine kinase [Ignavibacteria bacterium]|nr:MAG: PAS/PAC sensor signal transduction histidine kinase [Ignavibacteria bacterium]KAF0158903.1 MAG: PAS/PAC sensor signal transduction histidine kinase [Ignavibacteria bacterium]
MKPKNAKKNKESASRIASKGNTKSKKEIIEVGDIFAAATPILITDSVQNFIKANKPLADIFDTKPNKLTYNFLNEEIFFASNNKKIAFEELPFIRAAKEKTNITNFEIKITDQHGVQKWFLINSFVSKKTKEIFVYSFFVEVTRQKEIQNIYNETISSITTVLYSTSPDGTNYNFVSEAVRSVFGYSPEDVYKYKNKILRSIVPAYFKDFKNFIHTLKQGKEAAVEYKLRDRFGKEHWVRHTGTPIFKNGEVSRVVGIIQDITEEKNTQLKLTNSEERFRMLIDTADDLIFILNGFGYFSMVNKSGATTLGYMPEEMIGRHFLEFVDKDEEKKVAEAFTKILESSGITIFEVNILDRFDKPVLFEIHARPVLADGIVSGMLSIGRNITRRKSDEQKIKELNAKLIEANRIISIERERARHKITVLEELNKLKSEFISNVSHELRTPLASIVGFAETIYFDLDLSKDTLKEFSSIILTEGRRLAKLINDLLDFSKLESGEEELQKDNIDITEVLEKVLLSFEQNIKDKNLILSKEFLNREIIINADRERLKKVFSNILSNAIKFTNSGGRISVFIHDFGKEIEVAISDTGIGIPEKDLPNLFQKFGKVTRPGALLTGAGFGLVSTKQIIDLHKGFIKVRSEEDKGTTFIIRLPR